MAEKKKKGPPSPRRLTVEMTYDMVQSLTTTAESFEGKLQKKLKEKEEQENLAQQQATQRHTRIIKGITTIRKALQETSKIKMGPRFKFKLDVDDYHGWPRVQLILVDKKSRDIITHCLVISAHDKQESGTILIQSYDERLLGKIELNKADNFRKIPIVLKNSVRAFLDEVEEYVLNPASAVTTKSQNPEPMDVSSKQMTTTQFLSRADIFSEDLQQGNNVIQVKENQENNEQIFNEETLEEESVALHDENLVKDSDIELEPLDLGDLNFIPKENDGNTLA